MSAKTVRLGGASGFWGDSAIGAPQLVAGGRVDYLVFDYLAEVTMSIMASARARRPELGYATDFVDVAMRSVLPELKRQGIRVVSNAGGVNPLACRDALQRLAAEAGVPLKIGVVLGDDLLDREGAFREAEMREMYSGAPFPERLMSINAYLGARPIAAALDRGCDVVITGRCVDSAVSLGPLIHEFGWAEDAYDALAHGTVVGHLIECGAQCTGGLFTDWRRTGSWENIGYPVAEVSSDGSFTIEKPPGTDGVVCFGSVAEQIVYEIQDPGGYLVPDVTTDLTGVRIEELDDGRVRVSGARGLPPTETYKVSATYQDGYRLVSLMAIGGFEAADKARRTGETILARTRRMFLERNLGDYAETRIEAIGAEDMFGPHGSVSPREVVLKIAARHLQKEALSILAREVAPAGTSMAPGTTGLGGGRASPTPVVRLFSFLLDKAEVPLQLDIDGERIALPLPARPAAALEAQPRPAPLPAEAPEGETEMRPLVQLAYGRSGDKGDKCNIGIIARRPEYLPLLRWWLTEERVRAHFAHICQGPVERFDMPGIGGMNFLLHDTLGGGGMASLRTDNLGKAFAQVLLSMPVPVPTSWSVQRAA